MLSTIRQRFRLLMAILIVVIIAVGLFVQFAFTPEHRLYALDATSGKVAWSIPSDLSWSGYTTPVIDSGRVIVATSDTSIGTRSQHWQLSAYDATSGRILWTYAPFGQAGVGQLCAGTVAASPVVADGYVYMYVCAATDPNNTTTFDKTTLVALDDSTGRIVWEHDEPTLNNILNDGAPLPLRVLNGSVYLLLFDKSGSWGIDVLDEKNGNVTRHIDLPDLAGDEPPLLPVSNLQTDGQTLFVNIKGLTAVEPVSGKVLYTLKVQTIAWTAENGLYATSYDGQTFQFAGYDGKSGAVRWQRAIDKTLTPDAPHNTLRLTFQVSADAQTVYVFVTDVQSDLLWLAAFKASDGSTRWIKPVQIDSGVANVLAKVTSTPDLVVYNQVGDETGIRALAASDGSDRWFFPAYTQDLSPATDGQRIYFLDESLRYKNWLAQINPAWHG